MMWWPVRIRQVAMSPYFQLMPLSRRRVGCQVSVGCAIRSGVLRAAAGTAVRQRGWFYGRKQRAIGDPVAPQA